MKHIKIFAVPVLFAFLIFGGCGEVEEEVAVVETNAATETNTDSEANTEAEATTETEEEELVGPQPIGSVPLGEFPCADAPEGEPYITKLSEKSGEPGDKLEIFGCNFTGFEGDMVAWIENPDGEKGILRGEAGSTDKHLFVTLDRRLCQEDTSYSGLPCDSWLKLDPAHYLIYVMPWGNKSNTMKYTIMGT